MKQISKYSSLIIIVSSIIAISAFASQFILKWKSYQENWTSELLSISLQIIFFLTPAILGLLIFRNRTVSAWIVLGFIFYAFLLVASYYNVIYAKDAIGAGVPMMLYVFPFTIFLSVILLNKINKK